MKPNICCMKDCDNIYHPLHKFPDPYKERERFNAWVKVTGNKHLFYEKLDDILKKRKVCEKHFSYKQRSYWDPDGRLRSNAVPDIFLGLPGANPPSPAIVNPPSPTIVKPPPSSVLKAEAPVAQKCIINEAITQAPLIISVYGSSSRDSSSEDELPNREPATLKEIRLDSSYKVVPVMMQTADLNRCIPTTSAKEISMNSGLKEKLPDKILSEDLNRIPVAMKEISVNSNFKDVLPDSILESVSKNLEEDLDVLANSSIEENGWEDETMEDNEYMIIEIPKEIEMVVRKIEKDDDNFLKQGEMKKEEYCPGQYDEIGMIFPKLEQEDIDKFEIKQDQMKEEVDSNSDFEIDLPKYVKEDYVDVSSSDTSNSESNHPVEGNKLQTDAEANIQGNSQEERIPIESFNCPFYVISGLCFY